MKQKYFFKFILTGLLFLFSLCPSFGQVITTIDFETANLGYSPSTTFGTGNTDAFNRTNNGVNGNSSYYWVAEDINNDPTIDLSQLNISGSQSFTFAIDLSYPNASQWDSTDELIITYSIDGGAYQNLMAVQHINNDPYNEPAALDLDFDGNGDTGQELSTSAFTTFTTSSISLSSNSTLDIKLQFNKLTSNGEGIFIDNIIITEAEDLPSANISYSENFSDCSTHDWTVVTVGAETEWICGSGYFQANAYNSSGAADDYLISPSFDMDAQTGETLSFTSWTKYEDTGDSVQNIELLYTTNYTGDPSTTTWVNTLSPTWPVADSETNTGSGNLDISTITGTAVHFAFRYTSTGTGSNSTEGWRIDNISIGGTLSVTDDQTIASDINLDVDISSTGSLTLNSNSDINGDVTIADGGELTLNGSGTISGSVTISNGGSLIATDGSVTGNITYNRNIPTTNWYLVSSPVVGQDIDAFVAAEGLASGTGSNIGLSDYNNTTPGWEYYQNGASGTGNFTSGDGRSIKLASTGDISFTGTINTSDVNISITDATGSGGNAFNLVGNPYPSFIAANNNADGTNNILKVNDTDNDYLTESTIWFWNQGTSSYNQINHASTAKYIAPGQGFFVSTDGAYNFSITEDMQSHQSTDSFQRSNNNRPEINLAITNGTNERNADIYYIEGTTTGWDNGYDSSIFGGVANEFAIYTHTVANGNGRDLGIQSLPPNNFENMIVPVGINAEAGTPITIGATTNNFPEGINIYLEDKQDNSFTLLEADSNFSFTPENNLSGIGRFYLHTTSGVLSADDFATNNNISIYTSGNDNLRIAGVQNGTATVRLYNILGKEVLKTSFIGSGVNDINLNAFPVGIYIVKLTTENGTLNRKIIIQ